MDKLLLVISAIGGSIIIIEKIIIGINYIVDRIETILWWRRVDKKLNK